MKIHLYFKQALKRFLFNLSADYPFLYTWFHKLFYRPRKGTLAEVLDVYSRTHSPVTFVQVGANDGFFHDPLHKFIKMYSWSGVMLEPQRYVYQKFLSRLHRRSKGVVAVNAAMSDRNGKRNMYRIGFSDARWATGLTTFNREALEEAIESGHVARCARRYGDKLPADRNNYILEEQIDCITSDNLLQTFGLKQIHWLQIDAEGYDYEIIKLMNIPRTKPQVIVFEHSHLSTADLSECTGFLKTLGYKVGRIDENTIAILSPEGELSRFVDD